MTLEHDHVRGFERRRKIRRIADVLEQQRIARQQVDGRLDGVLFIARADVAPRVHTSDTFLAAGARKDQIAAVEHDRILRGFRFS